MKFTKLFLILILFSKTHSGYSDTTRLPGMPSLEARKTYTVPSDEAGHELLENRGYGDKESEVKMMNLMMVEGSGYEGMDMGSMSHSSSATSQNNEKPSKIRENFSGILLENPPTVGPNTFEVSLLGPGEKPKDGLKLKAFVSMSSMDMGTEEVNMQEISPGKYRAKIIFSMPGPWAVRVKALSGEEKTFSFQAEKSKH